MIEIIQQIGAAAYQEPQSAPETPGAESQPETETDTPNGEDVVEGEFQDAD